MNIETWFVIKTLNFDCLQGTGTCFCNIHLPLNFWYCQSVALALWWFVSCRWLTIMPIGYVFVIMIMQTVCHFWNSLIVVTHLELNSVGTSIIFFRLIAIPISFKHGFRWMFEFWNLSIPLGKSFWDFDRLFLTLGILISDF